MTSFSSTVFDLLPFEYWYKRTTNYEFMIKVGVLEIRDTNDIVVQKHNPGVCPKDGIFLFTLHMNEGQFYISNGFWNDSISQMYQSRDGHQIFFDEDHVSGLETLGFSDKYEDRDSGVTFPSRVFLKETWELNKKRGRSQSLGNPTSHFLE